MFVAAIDGAAQIELAPHRQTFTLRMPAPGAAVLAAAPPTAYVYPVQRPPAACRHPLRLLLNQFVTDPDSVPLPAGPRLPYVAVHLPGLPAAPSAAESTRFIPAPPCISPRMPSVAPVSDAIIRASRERPISTLWTPEATYFVVRKQPDPVLGDSGLSAPLLFEIEALWHDDGALIRTNDSFTFAYLFPPVLPKSGCDPDPLVYRIADAPHDAIDPDSGKTYPIKRILAECLDLYYTASRLHLAGSLANTQGTELHKPKPRPAFSASIAERVVVPGSGDFCAFGDRRVRVAFDDRTIAEIHCPPDTVAGGQCSILDQHGQSHVLRTDRPVGFERLVLFSESTPNPCLTMTKIHILCARVCKMGLCNSS
nr:hypothetical protein HK105_000898 [Polyrhizophydium stewartii]